MLAVNWNKKDDLVVDMWRQNTKQFWLPEEFNVSRDIPTWTALSDKEKETFNKVLAGLTGLDTQQSDMGMPLVLIHTEDLRKQAVYAFMCAMEAIHAKSYSTIFTTLISSEETAYLLEDWVVNNKYLQYKANKIAYYYKKLLQENPTKYDQYMARVASVFLESFLFYSGFFYPLYLSGQGKLTTSGEIIRKILLDETIHGSFTGWDAQSIYETLSEEEKTKADKETYNLLDSLMTNELEYTKSIYDNIGLTQSVEDYVKYNANRALANLGKDNYYDHNPINPIIVNAMDTRTKNHDFFSVKGDGYVMSLNVEEVSDDDFNF